MELRKADEHNGLSVTIVRFHLFSAQKISFVAPIVSLLLVFVLFDGDNEPATAHSKRTHENLSCPCFFILGLPRME